MALIDFAQPADASPELRRGDIVLRAPRNSHYAMWRDLREESRAHLTRWEPDWTDADATLTAFKERVRGYTRAIRRGSAAPYFSFRVGDGALVGGVTLMNIVRGSSQSGSLGYWTGAKYARRGFARDGVLSILGFAFQRMSLNRIEAACQPGNTASLELLRSIGFMEEGLARDYLHINVAWRDHLIFAMTAGDWLGRGDD